jgi:hypothetical protein
MASKFGLRLPRTHQERRAVDSAVEVGIKVRAKRGTNLPTAYDDISCSRSARRSWKTWRKTAHK